MERLDFFNPPMHKITDKLLSARRNDAVPVSVKKLVADGFGSEQELLALIKNKTIKGGYADTKTPEGTKKVLVVNVNDTQSKDVLRDLRRMRCIGIRDLSLQSGISLTRLEDAVLNGEMDAIKNLYLQYGTAQLLIDKKSQKNIMAFDKLAFEDKLLKSLQQQEKAEDKERQSKEKSLIMKLTWDMCPSTKKAAAILMNKNPKVVEIRQKINELKASLKDYKAKSDERISAQEAIEALEVQEQIEIKKFFKNMWDMAGVEEFSNAHKRATIAVRQYQAGGLEAVQDDEIKYTLTGLIK